MAPPTDPGLNDPPKAVTSVHYIETTDRPKPRSPHFERRHSLWAPRRQKIYDAFLATHTGYSRREAYLDCGAGYWILRSRDDHAEIRIVPDHCHDRFCEPCGYARQAVIRENLADKLDDHPHRFLTLTLKSDAEPLKQLLDKLLRCFKRLRNTVFWCEKVRGGATFIELTANPETGAWHPHLHVILDGKWLEHSVLRQLWRQITGDSYVVDISLIYDRQRVIHYITKYATKPLPTAIVNDAPKLQEAILALKGRKLCYTFGTWSRWRLLKPADDDKWETLCHANELRYRWQATDDYYDQIMLSVALHIMDPELDHFTLTVSE